MFYKLILLCSSLNGVITVRPDVIMLDGNNDCLTDALCKSNPADGFRCKVAGGNQEVTVTNCDVLNIHYDRWSWEEIINRHTQWGLEEIQLAISALQNATRAISEEVETVKNWQAVAAATSTS